MLNGGIHLDRDRFEYVVVYMKRAGDNRTEFSRRFGSAGVDYAEFGGKGIFDFWQFNRMTRFVKQTQPDIIHCHEERTDLYGFLLKLRLPDVKVISTIHGERLITSPRRWLFSRIDRYLLKRFDTRIAVSKQVFDYATRLGIEVNRIVENGIDVQAWSPKSRDVQDLHLKKPLSRTWVGFVGRISYEKGPLEFVRMASHIAIRNQEVDFVVAGDGEASSSMRQLVRELRLENRFHFLGEINPLQLRMLYRSLDVLVSPSHTEGLPNNLLEACAMTTPIVATRVGGVPELIQNGYNGLLVEPEDAPDLADKTLRVITEPDLGRRMGAHARELVAKRFSVTSHVKKMEQLYQDLVSQPA